MHVCLELAMRVIVSILDAKRYGERQTDPESVTKEQAWSVMFTVALVLDPPISLKNL